MNEKKHKKKKKKRKRDVENGEEKERECVSSHLDKTNQEEEWCQGGMWSLTSEPDLTPTIPTQCESGVKEQEKDSLVSKKKKKKKKKVMQLVEALQPATSACSSSKRWA